MQTDEERLEIGRKELETLRGMFRGWLESDFRWALGKVIEGEVTGKDDEWNFLWDDWADKFINWMGPYLIRLRDVKSVSEEEVIAFGEEMYNNMKMMLSAIYALSEGVKDE